MKTVRSMDAMRNILIFSLLLAFLCAYGGQQQPLTDDELAALRYLDHVTGSLPPDQENDYWNFGGSQSGLYSTRYSIAFAGYAAAALGMRTPAYPAPTIRILENCIRRLLDKQAYKYIQGKEFWGDKPWFPDPCRHENIMYSGHLLHLLALYESFSGDDKYHTQGFDFIWDQEHVVHYTVEKLIDVTMQQIQENESHGVPCEPSLVFFACNCHPHIAFKIFAAMEYGDWTAEQRLWETWALKHLTYPLFGGGAFALLHHAGTGITYSKGDSWYDGWCMLCYQPWAENLKTVQELWDRTRRCIDWDKLAREPNVRQTSGGCCSPVKIPPILGTTFLAAAARACGDTETAEKAEAIADGGSLRRDNGMYRIEASRECRIWCSALRITALAVQNGSDLRQFVQHPFTRETYRRPYLKRVEPESAEVRVAEWLPDGSLRLAVSGPSEITLYLENYPEKTIVLPGEAGQTREVSLKPCLP